MLRISVPIELAALADAQDRIEAFLQAEGAPPPLILRVRLVVEELLANLVMHGRFAAQPPPAARVSAGLEGRRALLTIEDAAAPFDPRQGDAPMAGGDLAEVKIGGLGLPLVRRMAQIQAYERLDGGWNRTDLVIEAS